MISTKKLMKMARKWRQMAAMGRKNILLPGANGNTCSTSIVAGKGHFVAYTVDGKRFVFPIQYLNSYIFRELLIKSEEEFGLPSDGPITFPCDSLFMDYAANLIRHRATKEMEEALLMSIADRRSTSYSLRQQEINQQLLCAF